MHILVLNPSDSKAVLNDPFIYAYLDSTLHRGFYVLQKVDIHRSKSTEARKRISKNGKPLPLPL
jgi:hypothetical protein